MISQDIENLKLQLIKIANQRGGQLFLDKRSSGYLIDHLDSFEMQVTELEKQSVPSEPMHIDDLTNIAFFPTQNTANKEMHNE
ncbi:MAG: hypothetical protein CBB87_08175 [Micavibrio sp. TMED27]|nr:hypothetical protein [Micavibrio sp.]OUT90647.1 MAG: hypothetical protein CBB87_08175 [Micavibrio sp. TMED27]|tara:strand:+ start:4360 stop:4608 length:249 start_codon:yes stop_codon:yes gene_type:complete